MPRITLYVIAFLLTLQIGIVNSREPITPTNADQAVELLRLGRGTVNDLAISPDGNYLAVASGIGVWLYTYPDLEDIAYLDDHANAVESVRYGPDGNILVTYPEFGPIVIRDAQSGQRLHTLSDTEGWIMDVAFTPDATKLITALGSTIVIWDVESGEMLHRIYSGDCCTRTLAVSPDGTTFAASSSGVVVTWDVISGDSRGVWAGHLQSISIITYSPDGRVLASGSYDGKIIIRDAVTGNRIHQIDNGERQITALSYTSDGTILAAGDRAGNIVLWNADTGDKLTSYELTQYNTPSVKSIDFLSLNQRILATYENATIALWDRETELPAFTLDDQYQAVRVAPDAETFVALTILGTFAVHDSATGEITATHSAHFGYAPQAAFGPDNQSFVFTGSEGTIAIWDILANAQLNDIRTEGTYVLDLCYTSDARHVAASIRWNQLLFWHLETDQPIDALTIHDREDNIYNIACAPNSQTVASAEGNTIMIWDLQTGNLIKTLGTPIVDGPVLGTILDLIYTPSGDMIVAALRDGRTIVWDVESGELRYTLTGHSEIDGLAIDIAPNGQTLASVGWAGTVILWDVVSGIELVAFEIPYLVEVGDSEIDIVFAPDGRTVATNRYLQLWDAQTGDLLTSFDDQQGNQTLVIFAPNGRVVASVSERANTIMIWETATGNLLRELTGHTDSIRSLSYSLDGSYLLSASADGTVRLWGL
ncbi:MAG: hypothetical protein OHK0046_38730 [Anaerolineae bacterium]